MGFALGFFVLLKNFDTDKRFDHVWSSFMYTFIFATGEIDLPFIVGDVDDEEAHQNWMEVICNILLICLVFAVTICYMNVLIAMMSQSYEKITETATVEAIQNIAKALIRYEGTMSTQERKHYNAMFDCKCTEGRKYLKIGLSLIPQHSHNAWIRQGKVTIVVPRVWDLSTVSPRD